MLIINQVLFHTPISSTSSISRYDKTLKCRNLTKFIFFTFMLTLLIFSSPTSSISTSEQNENSTNSTILSTSNDNLNNSIGVARIITKNRDISNFTLLHPPETSSAPINLSINNNINPHIDHISGSDNLNSIDQTSSSTSNDSSNLKISKNDSKSGSDNINAFDHSTSITSNNKAIKLGDHKSGSDDDKLNSFDYTNGSDKKISQKVGSDKKLKGGSDKINSFENKSGNDELNSFDNSGSDKINPHKSGSDSITTFDHQNESGKLNLLNQISAKNHINHVQNDIKSGSDRLGSFDHNSNNVNTNFDGFGDEESVDDEEDDESEYDYYDNTNLETQWGSEFSKNLTDEIVEIERGEERENEELFGPVFKHDKPKISKCCPIGQGLNAQGACVNMTHHAANQTTLWFPDRIINKTINSIAAPDISQWEISSPTTIRCLPSESLEIISDINLFYLVSNGKLFLTQHLKEIGPSQFCLDHLIGRGQAVQSCFSREEICKDGKCLRKCCPEGAMVQETTGDCVIDPQTHKNKFPHELYNIVHGNPSCPFNQYLIEIDKFDIGTNGSLHIKSLSHSIPFLDYCIDFFIRKTDNLITNRAPRGLVVSSKDNTELKISHHHHGHKNTGLGPSKNNNLVGGRGSDKNILPVLKAMICFSSSEDERKKKREEAGLIELPREMEITYGVAFILSTICIALAGLISWKLPELRSLHGKCQLSHLLTLFLLFTFLAVVQLGSGSLVYYSTLCKFLAVSLHTCALSAFLWLNLLCVNIYLTFRSLRPPLAARRDENRRLLFLCIYAWGIPLAFCIFLLLLDSEEHFGNMPRPMYGEHTCLISNREAMFAYLYGPVGLLLLLNGLLFCLTARELLCGLWRLDNSDSLSFRRKSMGIVVAKLGIVMGMGWILDVLSWALGHELKYLFYVADLFNGLQGVFIFLVLIWRKRVLEVLRLRKPSIMKDDTLTARPFLPKTSLYSTPTLNGGGGGGGDPDTSLVLVQDCS